MTFRKRPIQIIALLIILSSVGVNHSYAQENVPDEESYKTYTTEEEILNDSLYNDIPSNHHYMDAVRYLHDEGVMNGYADGTFKPYKYVNRAEFSKVMMTLLINEDLSTKGGCFADIHEEWFAPYVCEAKSKGIINGYDDNTFRPNDVISFVEAAKIIVEAFDLPIDQSVETDPWYKPYVVSLEKKQAIPALIDNFDQPLFRIGMAEMLWRIKELPRNKVTSTFDHIKSSESSYPFHMDESIANRGLVEWHNVHLETNERIDGIDENTLLEIKAMTLNENHSYLGQNDFLLTSYKDLVYSIKIPHSYHVYPEIDATSYKKLSIFGGSNSEGSTVEGNDLKIIFRNKMYLIRDDNHVYLVSHGRAELLNIDADTFTALDDLPYGAAAIGYLEFFKDKDHVFVIINGGIQLLEGADPKTFERILNVPDQFGVESFIGDYFFKDTDTVFYQHYLKEAILEVEGIDLETFQITGENTYQDKNAFWGYSSITGDFIKTRSK